jgi:D-serine deaminase-like pyridoxal phosphate-dependent protein
VHVTELPTPALVIDLPTFERNVSTMAAARPGASLRPHVKAFKSTMLDRRLADAGHLGFCAATSAEVLGMARAGLGHDLLLANELVDPVRLRALARCDARVTVAVDSYATIDAAADNGIREVLIDVDVGMPRCGCRPDDAGRLAERARRRGLSVRGVMGYEGHLMMEPGDVKPSKVADAMALLLAARPDGWCVGDGGLKSLGMDHGGSNDDRPRGVRHGAVPRHDRGHQGRLGHHRHRGDVRRTAPARPGDGPPAPARRRLRWLRGRSAHPLAADGNACGASRS